MINQSLLDEKLHILASRQEAISNKVIDKITQRIVEIGTMLPSDIFALQQLYRSGADVREINQIIATGTAMQVKEIQRTIQEIARDFYVDAKPYYDYSKTPFIPYKDNKPLQRIVNAIAKRTSDSFVNIANSKATGFVMKDRATKKIVFMDMKKVYQNVIDEGIQSLSLGVTDYKSTVRKTLKQLTDSGVRGMYWDGGYNQRLDTAIQRNILEGCREISIEVDKFVGKEFGADGIELSAHPMSAPDHEPFQGHCFKNAEFNKLQDGKDFEDIYGNKFNGVERAIGMWNCRHYTHSVIIDTYKPVYSQEKLREFIEKNKKGYTTSNGKHYTLYECTQVQRQLETKIRRLKDEWVMLNGLGDTQYRNLIQSKIRENVAEYKLFCSECKIQSKMENLTVSGYKNV